MGLSVLDDSTIVVTGGAGYIGSHVVRMLDDIGANVLVIDDLSEGFVDAVPPSVPLLRMRVGNVTEVRQVLHDYKVGAVMHFASLIRVGESVKQPGHYYLNNVAETFGLLHAMTTSGVRYFVFSSTAAIFGVPACASIDEDHPQRPVNAYGRGKSLVEQVLPDFEAAHGLQSVCLRYFNAAGAHPDASVGERHDPETHVIPLAIAAALGHGPTLKVFGVDYPTADGTCVRDYVHVMDLADAHLRALNYLAAGGVSTAFNLGNGNGYSVREVIDTVADVLGRPVPYEIVGRREGDPAVLVADASKAGRVLGWWPRIPALRDIVSDAVRFHLARH